MSANSDAGILSTHVAVVGAGPIGLELAIALKRAGIDYIHFEAQQIGHTFTWWPRGTYFFSTTERIEIAGIPIQNLTQQRTTGEEYLAYLRSVVEQLDLPVRTYEPVVAATRQDEGFLLRTAPRSGERQYRCHNLVLAIGDMHNPNRLGIPGEDLPHVSHYFRDVHPYFRQRLLIVGGRNSAAEAALRCWRAGAQVTLSYRRADFKEKLIKHWILPDLKTQIELGTIGFQPLTVPVSIRPAQVVLERLAEDGTPTGERFQHATDFVLLLTGFRADMSLFEEAGVTLTGENQQPVYDPETMETDVPGLYVAGTAAAGHRQPRYALFIENTHIHVAKIVKALTGCTPERLGTVPARQYDLPLEAFQDN
ncbi:MAG: NAD(P)-binding domain-containing protein [Anaerolineae bacterium]|jgi:thioredoxin reductase (NADPH)